MTTLSSSKIEKRDIFLILEIDNPQGLLIEKEGCEVVNLGLVSYTPEHHCFGVDETHGGIASYHRADDLVKTLLKEKFILRKPNEIRKLLGIRHVSDEIDIYNRSYRPKSYK